MNKRNYLILIIVCLLTFLFIFFTIQFILKYNISDSSSIDMWFSSNKFKFQNIFFYKQINIDGEFDIDTLRLKIEDEKTKSLKYNETIYQEKLEQNLTLREEYENLENLINQENIALFSIKTKIDDLNI